MTAFEQTLLREVYSLPEERRADVLAFVRYLKISLMDDDEIEKRFEKSLKSVRARAKKLKITQEDIDAEIRAVRAEHARGS
jgi:hypothetical protein